MAKVSIESSTSSASAGANPNFESLWPVTIFRWVSAVNPRRDPHEHPLHHVVLGGDPVELVELPRMVDHDQAAARLDRRAQIGVGLVVAVNDHRLGRIAPAASAAASSPSDATSAPRPSPKHLAQDGDRDVCLTREHRPRGAGIRAQRLDVGAGAVNQRAPVINLEGRTELTGELGRVDPADP